MLVNRKIVYKDQVDLNTLMALCMFNKGIYSTIDIIRGNSRYTFDDSQPAWYISEYFIHNITLRVVIGRDKVAV